MTKSEIEEMIEAQVAIQLAAAMAPKPAPAAPKPDFISGSVHYSVSHVREPVVTRTMVDKSTHRRPYPIENSPFTKHQAFIAAKLRNFASIEAVREERFELTVLLSGQRGCAN
jgi:hypothetical protein